MADDKKNIPDAGKVNEPAKAENTEPMKADPAMPEQPAPSKPETRAVEGMPKTTAPPAAEKAPTPGQANPKGKDNPTPSKENKPQPGKTDQQYRKRAEELLHEELSVALGISFDEVPAYIEQRISALEVAQGA